MTHRSTAFSSWTILLSVVSGGLLLLTLFFSNKQNLTASTRVTASTTEQSASPSSALIHSPHETAETEAMAAEWGSPYSLTYEQWIKLLEREAATIAQKPPKHLYILAGDSLSLWFPGELLPDDVTWLNQGISGETSYGLLRRVKFFDQTKPQTIFVMIGINDLIRGFRYETVVANHREIIRHLKAAHPTAQIVVQSVLPHGGDRARRRYQASVKDDPAPEQNPLPLWVKRLPVITNPSIRRLNQQLAQIAREERVEFLDLHSQFTDDEGNLREALTTDGLHLSPAGYALWRSQLQPYLLTPSETPSKTTSR